MAPKGSKRAAPKEEAEEVIPGDVRIDLGGRKYATVRAYKGYTMVDIREFYEKEGLELPGKKV